MDKDIVKPTTKQRHPPSPEHWSQRLLTSVFEKGLTSPVPCLHTITPRNMCYYRFYIYLTCGHSSFSSTPVRYCPKATNKSTTGKDAQVAPAKPTSPRVTVESRPQSPQDFLLYTPPGQKEDTSTRPSKRLRSPAPTDLEPCREGLIHPLHTVKIDTLCPGCVVERDERLQALAVFSTEIKFDPERWRKNYRASAEGRDAKRQNVVDGVEEGGLMETGAKWIRDWRGTG
jgi:hypothetical protein